MMTRYERVYLMFTGIVTDIGEVRAITPRETG